METFIEQYFTANVQKPTCVAFSRKLKYLFLLHAKRDSHLNVLFQRRKYIFFVIWWSQRADIGTELSIWILFNTVLVLSQEVNTKKCLV